MSFPSWRITPSNCQDLFLRSFDEILLQTEEGLENLRSGVLQRYDSMICGSMEGSLSTTTVDSPNTCRDSARIHSGFSRKTIPQSRNLMELTGGWFRGTSTFPGRNLSPSGNGRSSSTRYQSGGLMWAESSLRWTSTHCRSYARRYGAC